MVGDLTAVVDWCIKGIFTCWTSHVSHCLYFFVFVSFARSFMWLNNLDIQYGINYFNIWIFIFVVDLISVQISFKIFNFNWHKSSNSSSSFNSFWTSMSVCYITIQFIRIMIIKIRLLVIDVFHFYVIFF